MVEDVNAGAYIPDPSLTGEYACHEGNYALSNILGGARYQERLEAGEEPNRR